MTQIIRGDFVVIPSPDLPILQDLAKAFQYIMKGYDQTPLQTRQDKKWPFSYLNCLIITLLLVLTNKIRA